MRATSSSETVSHYRLIEPIGRGAMGEVWLAEDLQLPRKVAVKLLPRHVSADREAVERLLREAQAAASVDHPYVVSVYEAGLADDRPYLVMQRVEGETLAERLRRGPLAVSEAVDLASKLADALAEVHALGIVHRDLKTSNVVLTARGPKILDFGLASVRGSKSLTMTGTALGTPATMSPEQVRGQPPDNRSDLWALGVMLYEALTGRTPFAGDTFEAMAYQILQQPVERPSVLRSGIAPELDFIVLKLLRKEPAQRYARAEDVIADLTSCREPDTGRDAEAESQAPRVAVLYFEVLSPDADDAFLAAGLAEDLIVDLSRVQGVRVANRAEVVPYRERVVPPRTIARELGVDFVLTGSVRRGGNRARISAQLVRGSDGQTIWTERFDRTLEDLFDVQAEVSERIVEALQIALRPGEREMLHRAPTRNREAYTLYLQARGHLDAESMDGTIRAEALLERAVTLDPSFALAHATLAEAYAIRAFKSPFSRRGAGDLALEVATRALALEENLIEAYTARSLVHFMRNDPESLQAAVAKVMELNPDRPQELEWTAWSLVAGGHPEQGLEIAKGLIERFPDRYRSYSYVATCYELMGMKEEFERATHVFYERLTEYIQRHPDRAHPRSLLAIELARQGQRDQAIAMAEQAVAQDPDDSTVIYNLACTYSHCHMRDEAVEALEKRFGGSSEAPPSWPMRDPDFANIRDHPGFLRIFAPRADEPRAAKRQL